MSDQKTELRRAFLAARRLQDSVTVIANSDALVRHLAAWLASRSFDQVFLYTPHRGEPDITGIAAHLRPGTRCGLPVVEGGGVLRFHQWSPGDPLRPNRYGIGEPERPSPVLAPGAGTVILVPSLALDKSGIRLGYGGGFYDRLLPAAAGATTVGIAFSSFVVDMLPRESHDYPLQWIATESSVYTKR